MALLKKEESDNFLGTPYRLSILVDVSLLGGGFDGVTAAAEDSLGGVVFPNHCVFLDRTPIKQLRWIEVSIMQ